MEKTKELEGQVYYICPECLELNETAEVQYNVSCYGYSIPDVKIFRTRKKKLNDKEYFFGLSRNKTTTRSYKMHFEFDDNCEHEGEWESYSLYFQDCGCDTDNYSSQEDLEKLMVFIEKDTNKVVVFDETEIMKLFKVETAREMYSKLEIKVISLMVGGENGS